MTRIRPPDSRPFHYIPGEERMHYAALLPESRPVHGAWGLCNLAKPPGRGKQLTRWVIDRGDVETLARALVVAVRIHSDLRPWEISAADWGKSSDAETFREWEAYWEARAAARRAFETRAALTVAT